MHANGACVCVRVCRCMHVRARMHVCMCVVCGCVHMCLCVCVRTVVGSQFSPSTMGSGETVNFFFAFLFRRLFPC